MRCCTNERLLARPQAEGARRRRPRHPQEGGGEDLLGLDAHHREVSQTQEANRRGGPEALTWTRTPSICATSEERRALWRQLEENDEATLERHCELWEECGGARVLVATMSRAVRRLGWTFKKSRWRPPSGTNRREVLGQST
jgi:hypothetical protein